MTAPLKVEVVNCKGGGHTGSMSAITKLIYARRSRLLSRPVREILALYGIEFPHQTEVGAGLVVEHRGFGLVVSGLAVIGENVTLYPGVTLGRAQVDPHNPAFEGIEIGDGVTIGTGAKVLGGSGVLVVGAGTKIGANAVLTQSTGCNEVWAGVPARRLRVS